MNRLTRVYPWTAEDGGPRPYDCMIAALGYERRSRYIAESGRLTARRKCAYGFSRNRELSYRSNQRWFQRHDFDVREVSDDGFRQAIREHFLDCAKTPDNTSRWCVDVSSMSRLRIASILAETLRHRVRLTIDFVYTFAKYVAPAKEMTQVESAGPVLDEFAGWAEPNLPVAAVFGLGYEYDKAVGALDFIEPAQVWAFQAKSRDPRYDREARNANSFLWGDLPDSRRLLYAVDDPFDTFTDLESLTFGLSRDSRPILIPFGPKIFTLCCLLVALVHSPRVAVWRVSSGSHEVPVDRASDGSLVGLRAVFEPDQAC